jgi:hypothetical protein
MGRHQPAILGGLFIGVLSSLPLVNMANVCCCLWVVVGGVLVVYLQQQNTPTPLETSEAVLGGALAGLIGALITVTAQLAMTSIMGPAVLEQVRSQLESTPDMPPQMRDFMLSIFEGRSIVLISLFVSLPIYVVFATLGSLLGLSFFRKKTPPQPQP